MSVDRKMEELIKSQSKIIADKQKKAKDRNPPISKAAALLN